MVRENGEWKLLSLGLLLLDLPSLEEEWDRAEIQANEKLAIAYLKEIAEAVETYRKTYTRLPDILSFSGRLLKDRQKRQSQSEQSRFTQ